jgi:hypothetical protein
VIGIVTSAIIGTSRIEKGRGFPSSEATSRGLGSINGVGEKQRRMTAQQTSPTPNHTRAMIIQAFTVSKQVRLLIPITIAHVDLPMVGLQYVDGRKGSGPGGKIGAQKRQSGS